MNRPRRSSRTTWRQSASPSRSRRFRPAFCSRGSHRKGEPFDLLQGGWTADYPDPANFLNFSLLDPKTGYGTAFSDPAAKRKLTVAARLSGPARYLAYGRLDADLTRNAVPWAAYGNGVSADFFSARMGCQVFQPARAFIDLAALCIKH